MKSRRIFIALLALLVILMPLVFSGVYASWVYLTSPDPMESNMTGRLSNFHYGSLYITKVAVTGGTYDSASATKSGDTNITADLDLTAAASSTVSVDVTFYNSTDAIYYYNKTETLSSDNNNIVYKVTGIAQKDAVDPKTYKTITVTFSYDNTAAISDTTLAAQLHFNFVVDKDSIGIVVAKTAVDRFREILNNIAAPNSYDTLDTAMDNRSGYNKASAVTYIGNVVGSSSTDSNVIENLFGSEFMSMDLDGDGKAEPITMMIKREDLDGNTKTGATYTYTNRNTPYTVRGVEMTLYITSQNLTASSGTVVVYAASFTIPEGGNEWVDLVPLTKGTATPNNYNGWGSNNSFNTDTWRSDDRKTLEELVLSN